MSTFRLDTLQAEGEVVFGEGHVVAHILAWPPEDRPRYARLFAVAPELLGALERLLAACDEFCYGRIGLVEPVKQSRAAISKALGEE